MFFEAEKCEHRNFFLAEIVSIFEYPAVLCGIIEYRLIKLRCSKQRLRPGLEFLRMHRFNRYFHRLRYQSAMARSVPKTIHNIALMTNFSPENTGRKLDAQLHLIMLARFSICPTAYYSVLQGSA